MVLVYQPKIRWAIQVIISFHSNISDFSIKIFQIFQYVILGRGSFDRCPADAHAETARRPGDPRQSPPCHPSQRLRCAHSGNPQ